MAGQLARVRGNSDKSLFSYYLPIRPKEHRLSAYAFVFTSGSKPCLQNVPVCLGTQRTEPDAFDLLGQLVR